MESLDEPTCWGLEMNVGLVPTAGPDGAAVERDRDVTPFLNVEPATDFKIVCTLSSDKPPPGSDHH